MDIQEIKEYYGEECVEELKKILGQDVSDERLVEFFTD